MKTTASVLISCLLVWAAFGCTPTTTTDTVSPAACCASSACTCAGGCECESLKAKVKELNDYAKRLQDDLRAVRAEKDKALTAKPVCADGSCKIAPAKAAQVYRAPTGYYAKQPVYGRFGRLQGYRTVWVPYQQKAVRGNCATCR
jgi:hypothetical protein